MITRRKHATTLLTGLAALGLVLGLTGCEVKNTTLTSGPGEVNFVKECGPTRVQITATNIGSVDYDISIDTNGVNRASRDDVPPGSSVLFTGPVNATQAQATYLSSAGGGPDVLFTEQLPAC